MDRWGVGSADPLVAVKAFRCSSLDCRQVVCSGECPRSDKQHSKEVAILFKIAMLDVLLADAATVWALSVSSQGFAH